MDDVKLLHLAICNYCIAMQDILSMGDVRQFLQDQYRRSDDRSRALSKKLSRILQVPIFLLT